MRHHSDGTGFLSGNHTPLPVSLWSNDRPAQALHAQDVTQDLA